MDFFTEHYDYIFATANAKAVDIVRKTGLNDLEDFRQEIFVFLFRRLDKYDAAKGAPHTFIDVCMESARKNIIRNIYRAKKKNHILDAVPIESVEEPAAADARSHRLADMQEYIQALPAPIRTICLDYFINGVTLPAIARRHRQTLQQVMEDIRSAMGGYIDEL